ncbi:MAG: right-handed parallel beta-helix repeat-containing protein [Armatimonadota bacterium]|jgi:hypothetical protein
MRSHTPIVLTIVVTLWLAPSARVRAADVAVSTADELRRAISQADPGTRILLAPGEYAGGMYLGNVQGAPDRPIVIAAADPEHPPRIQGGGSGFHFPNAAYLELQDLELSGATGNGLNIDDGGSFDTPAHHIVLRRLKVTDVGPRGNRDAIKLSGVDDFRVEECVIERWGDGGSAIDMVGCHRGVIESCTFRQRERGGGSGPQTKGGSSDIVIRRNRFEEGGGRAVNIGGSTGMAYFRPKPQGYEAKDILVEGNVFIGSVGPVAFVGVDGAVVRYNTIHRPGRWALRILQETRQPGFVPSRNGVFTDNIVVFRSDQWSEGGVNIGPGTAPETFRFARNLWYCDDQPARSAPTLPSEEEDGIVGQDPLFRDAENGDLRLREGSPAAGKGHTALPEGGRTG